MQVPSIARNDTLLEQNERLLAIFDCLRSAVPSQCLLQGENCLRKFIDEGNLFKKILLVYF